MAQAWAPVVRGRDLVPVFWVAVAVAVFGTFAGSVFDHTHKVDAEELTAAEVSAHDAGNGTQVVKLDQWGVSLTVPLAAEMPLLRYTTRSGSGVGLSSTDLEQIGPACLASRNGLGSLVRFTAGNYATSVHGDPDMHFIATINGYDYAYVSPQNACSGLTEASDTVNREESALFAALDSLAPLSN